MATTASSPQTECSHGRHHGSLRFDCPYRDAFAATTEEPLTPFHIPTIDREQLGTSATCSQGNQNIMGVITQGNLAMAARIHGHHLTSGIEILGLRRHHTPKTRQRPDYLIEILFIPAASCPGIALHLHHSVQEKPP